jgi:hypothetical protein
MLQHDGQLAMHKDNGYQTENFKIVTSVVCWQKGKDNKNEVNTN